MPAVALTIADDDDLAALALQHGLPFLEGFRVWLGAQNAMPGRANQSLKPYQLALATGRGLVAPSPVDGAETPCSASIPMADKSVFLRFDADEPFLVAAGDMAKGYPLSAVLLPDRGLLIKFDDPVWGISAKDADAVMDALANDPGGQAEPMASVLTGDANFAHVFWNQLPALDELNARGAAAPYRIVATHEPLGPLAAILPDLGRRTVVPIADYELTSRMGTRGIAVPAGSTFANSRIRDRVVAHCRSRAQGDEVRGMTDRLASLDGAPVFWLSVRTRNRTIANQQDLLARLVASLLERWDRCAIVMDGFSTPEDIAVPGRYDVENLRATADADVATADAILHAPAVAAAARRCDHVLLNAAGRSICESIALAQFATCYFCHHGTVQHKIGWTTGVPGIVHANAEVLALRPAAWASGMVAGSRRPDYLEPDDVVDAAAMAQAHPEGLSAERRRDLRLHNYRFADEAAVVRRVVGDFTRWAGARALAVPGATTEAGTGLGDREDACYHAPDVGPDRRTTPAARGGSIAMNSIVRLRRPAVAMPFDGERLTTALPRSQIEAEHLHRYLLARPFCAGREVLDIASGEGYGAAILADVATSVVGVDIDAGSVRHAARSYHSPNLSFRTGDVRDIPCADGSFDVAVSFETLEHVAEHGRFLDELKRVLKPGGLLIISTPDRDVYSSPDQPKNPFHLLELTVDEFRQALQARFAHVAALAQRAIIGSVIVNDAAGDGVSTFQRVTLDEVATAGGLQGAPYRLIMASSVPFAAPTASVYVEQGEYAFMVPEAAAQGEREAALRRELASVRQALERIEQVAADRAGAIEHLEGTLRAARRDGPSTG